MPEKQARSGPSSEPPATAGKSVRGIQDYEYLCLARELGLDSEAVVESVVRRGLGEAGSYGIDPKAWSRDPEEWRRARDKPGEMIDQAKKLLPPA